VSDRSLIKAGCASIAGLATAVCYYALTTTAPTTSSTSNSVAPRPTAAELRQEPIERADSIMAATPLADVRNLSAVDLALVTEHAQADSVKIKAAQKETGRRVAEATSEARKNRVADIQAVGPCKSSASRVGSLVTRHPNWSDTHIAHIACRSVVIGMSSDQAIAAWGRPDDVNRTTSAYGVSEQWVYEDMTGFHRATCISRTASSPPFKTKCA
jgi:hypothetical protein